MNDRQPSAETDRLKALVTQLAEELGEDAVSTEERDRVFYAQDVYAKTIPAGVVVLPADVEQLAAAVRAATAAKVAVIARGGGMSYTGGYVPGEEGSALISMERLADVTEINANDMYATVECGCTWKTLDDALRASGLRTPYWGTLSGLHATVGGSLSQNSIFWGSGLYGTAADSVLGLEVALADGTLLRTGSAAQRNAAPFFRYYGPDLTGLFLADSGALGVKARATLRLIERPAEDGFASFAFESHRAMLPAISDVSRHGLAAQCFAFDPALQRQRMQRESIAADLNSLAKVTKAQKSPLRAIGAAAKVALAGRRYMDDVAFSAHFMLEGRSLAAVKADLNALRKICRKHGGREIVNSIPKIARSHPFAPLTNMVGPRGERWAPVHCLVAHSQAVEVADAIDALFAKHADEIERAGVVTGHLYSYASTSAMVIEPVFFWPDELNELHRHTVPEATQRAFTDFGPRPENRALVGRLREELVDLFCEAGAVHMQVGKAYRYREGLREESLRLVRQIKSALDPDGRVNPKALGL